MNTRSSQNRYGTIAVRLHWASAVLVLAQLGLGLAMSRLGGGDNDRLHQIHVGVGLLVAVLTIGRVAWRVIEPSPSTPPMPDWRRVAYVANHVAFYVVLLALAVGGIAMLIASGVAPFPTSVDATSVDDGRLRDGHFVLALVFSALFVMHVVGVVTYQRTKGDVFARMGIEGVSSPTTDQSQS